MYASFSTSTHLRTPEERGAQPHIRSGWQRPVILILLALDSSISSDGIRGRLHKEQNLEIVDDVHYYIPDAIARSSPDIVLIDRDLPDSDGFTVAGEITRKSRGLPPAVIVVADAYRDGDMTRVAEVGARGYLIKDSGSRTLLAAIKAVATGGAWVDPLAAGELLEGWQDSATLRPDETELVQLTERERDVIRLVSQGQSNADIARQLHLSESTVKSHISRMLAKLSLRSRTQLAAFARDHRII